MMIVPAILGVLALGLSFDMFEISTTNFYIYDEADIKLKLQVETNEVLESKFRVINNSSELLDFLHLDPEVALREKYRSVRLSLYKSFLQADVDRSETVEILFYVNYEVGRTTFPPDAKLRTEWQTRPQKYVGTHYIKSITTGGQLLVSYKLRPSKPEYIDDIRAAVASYIGVSGVIDERLTKNLDRFTEAVAEKSEVQISTSTIGAFHNIPSQLHKVIEVALQFPKLVKNTDDGRGKILKVELVDLHTVQPKYLEYKRNPDLLPVLREVFEKYDDLRVSKKAFVSWANTHLLLPPEQQDQVNDYYTRLTKATRAMTSALAKLDTTGQSNQFDQAFKTYGDGEGNCKYLTELHALMRSIDN